MEKPHLNTFVPATDAGLDQHVLPHLPPGASITVVGAGAFGGWSAWFLLQKGFRVTLVDAWGPGNARSSSGDETRVIRSTYGSNALYFDFNVRALSLWKQYEAQWQKKLFYPQGVLWFCYEDKTPLVDDSLAFAQRHNMPYIYLSLTELRRRFPIVNTDDLHHAWFDPFGGYLKAREASQAVHEAFVKAGGQYIQAQAIPGKSIHGRLQNIQLSTGASITTDAYLFACGAWLSQLFPELPNMVQCTRQEVYYFGTPSTNAQHYENFPAWIDVDGKDFYYGIAGNAHRGFKIGVDKRGAPFNPSTDNRLSNDAVLAGARQFLGHRFPELQHAPLVESRVCPYENSSDGNFIFDVHPEAANLYLLGGGSGHGFKHGPALGECVSEVIAGQRHAPGLFRLNR